MKSFTVIAHRGASGYLPEHTLESVAAAHAMGADFIELDVVLTRDQELVVLHDLFLDAVTDVAQRFPSRQRKDGHFYAIDFTLTEIQSLHVHERRTPNGKPLFPDRFPSSHGIFRVPTLSEEILLIQGMNQSSGRNTGVYIEPKSPAWHTQKGQDIVADLLAKLSQLGYRSKDDRAIVQSFDALALERARGKLGCELRLVQLLGDNSWGESDTDFDALLTPEGLTRTKGYADGIGPWLAQVAQINPTTGKAEPTDLVHAAHQAGLFVHAYTLRTEQIPPELNGFDSFLEFLIKQAQLNGVFTDYPDKAIRVIDQLRR